MKCTLFRSRPFYLHCVLIDVSTVCYAMTWRATGSSGTLGYEYDQGGRLVRQHDEATGESLTYGYDRADRRILMAGANDKPIKDDIEMILVPAMGAFVTPNIQNKEIDKGD